MSFGIRHFKESPLTGSKWLPLAEKCELGYYSKKLKNQCKKSKAFIIFCIFILCIYFVSICNLGFIQIIENFFNFSSISEGSILGEFWVKTPCHPLTFLVFLAKSLLWLCLGWDISAGRVAEPLVGWDQGRCCRGGLLGMMYMVLFGTDAVPGVRVGIAAKAGKSQPRVSCVTSYSFHHGQLSSILTWPLETLQEALQGEHLRL